ncbi:hypothetical protein YQE_04770, partial [Dendroctonus ponderosae]
MVTQQEKVNIMCWKANGLLKRQEELQVILDINKIEVPCCQCGVIIEANPANMCVGCLRVHVDITEGISDQATLYFCRGCERYHQPPSEWIHCALESRELLTLCLKRLKGLNRVKLFDASFVWTEPHSKRIKHKVHDNATEIKPVHGGIDFFFATEAHAKKMIDFLVTVLPCKYHHSKKLISHDIHSNIYNYKFTYCLEIVPISKDSVICLPKKMTQSLGGISPICLVYRVTNTIHLIDPSRGQVAEVNSTHYWRSQFNSICNPKQLVEYIVLDIEPIMDKDRKCFPGQGMISTKHVLADVWIVKASELGITTASIHTRTHLGHILKLGDCVLGYNIADTNVNDPHFDKLDKATVPDVILVKKSFDDRESKRMRKRNWKLKRLADHDVESTDGNEFNEFMDDLEEDPELRRNVNIFKNSLFAVDTDDTDYDPNKPCITLDEMLDDLTVNDVEMTD